MIPKPNECRGCPLWEKDPNGFVRAEGTGSLGVLLVGEAGGKSERQTGLPFRPFAQAGSQLETIIKLAGFQREQFRIGNVVSCQPPNDYLAGAPYEHAAIEHCRVHRERIINEMKPRCLLALGEIAFRTLTGLAGPKQTISYMRGYVLESTYGIPLVGTYHPSFIKRGNQKFTGVCINDLQRACEVARHSKEIQEMGGLGGKSPSYETNPSQHDATEFYEQVRQHPDRLLAYDIETPWSGEVEEDQFLEEEKELSQKGNYDDSEISTVQFSSSRGTGICLPYIAPFIDVIRKILALENEKVTHNGWRFDNPRLAKAGIKVEGIVHDTMWAFHHLQPDLVGHFNLQSVASFYGFPFPWKHLNKSQPEFYGCADVDALQWIFPRLREQMIEKGVWQGYLKKGGYVGHVLGLEPILVGMSRRGIPVDNDRRMELGGTLEAQHQEYAEQMQEMVPEELLNCHPKEGYKRVPKDTTGMVLRPFGIGGAYNEIRSPEGYLMRWCRLEPFTPSSKQVLQYIKHKKHKVSTHIKTGNETADLKALEGLFKETGDKLYETILLYRGVEKLVGTYVKGWEPANDGRVHPEFLYKPATGQLSSVNPNAQNAPAGKGNDTNGRVSLARSFRRIIRAEKLHKLIEFDWKSFHGATMGFEAKDAAYIRLARLDMHSFLASYMVKEPAEFGWPDDQLMDYLGYIKKKYKAIRDTQAKPAILGAQFGEEAYGLHLRYPDFFPKKNSAQPVLDLLDNLFPMVASYKRQIVQQAYRKKYLVSLFGYIRWFWNTHKWDSKNGCLMEVKGGDGDANKCKAFLVANDAFGHKKEVMLDLARRGMDDRFGLINDIHDALLFHCPCELVDECLTEVKKMMEAPSRVLVDPVVAPQGLWVEVEAKVGEDWSKMEEVKINAHNQT